MRAPAYDSLTLRAVVTERSPDLAGGQVQKIRQPDDLTVLLRIHRYPRTETLLLSAHPERFRAHATTQEFAVPQTAPAFCMALRKYLEGGRILSLEQEGADRILRLACATPHGTLALVAELMGRHSNIVLVDEGGTILEAVKHVGSKMSHRVVLPGRPYPPLPESGKPSLWDAPLPDLGALWEKLPRPLTAKVLLDAFGGMSPFLAEYVLATDDPRATLFGIVEAARTGAFLPHVYRDADGTPLGAWPFPPPGTDADASREPLSMSEALDIAYAARTTAARRERLLRAINAMLDREEETLARRLADLAAIEESAERAEEWRVMGDLLTANQHAIAKGQTEVTLPNYYDPQMRPLTIPLDPQLSPRENAEGYYARQRKARAAAERVPQQRRELEARAAELGARRARVAEADGDALEALLATWAPEAPVTGRKEKAEPEYPPGVRIRRYTSDEGYTILVGENATGNDYLTTRLSDPDDIWLHVRAAASAHGVIRTAKKPNAVPPATLRRAAEIVAARSEAKGSAVIPVDYTLRRYVRKPRGAAPGRVTYEREKTLFVGE